MYRFNSKVKKSKKIALVTEQTFFCLSRHRLNVEARIPLTKISKISLIKNSAALMQLSYEQGQDLPLETLMRTELIYFIVRQAEKYGWDKPKL